MARVVNGQGGGGVSLSDATPQPTGSPATADPGASSTAARSDHVHAASVAAADLTDAGAAGVAVVQAETAAEVRAAIHETADALTGTGWTTTNGNGTAAVSGGSLVVSGASGANLSASFPLATRALPSTARGLVWRIAALTGDSAAVLEVGPDNPTTGDSCLVTVTANGSGGSTVDTTISVGYWDGASFVSGGSGVVARGGDWWVWQDYSVPGTIKTYIGKGTSSTPPGHLGWAPLGSNSVASGGWGANPGVSAVFSRIYARLYKGSSLGSTTSGTVDGLVVLS